MVKLVKEDGIVKKNLKGVPVKNYIYLSLIILVTILLVFYFYLWYLTYKENKLNNQVMDRYLQVINYNELSDYLTENKDAYVYVSVLEDQEIRDFELEFKTLIMDNSLKKEILYLDLTNVYNDKNLISKANKDYQVGEKNISDVPCILVFKEGVLKEIYDIRENNYEMENLKEFLLQEGFEIDD